MQLVNQNFISGSLSCCMLASCVAVQDEGEGVRLAEPVGELACYPETIVFDVLNRPTEDLGDGLVATFVGGETGTAWRVVDCASRDIIDVEVEKLNSFLGKTHWRRRAAEFNKLYRQTNAFESISHGKIRQIATDLGLRVEAVNSNSNSNSTTCGCDAFYSELNAGTTSNEATQ